MSEKGGEKTLAAFAGYREKDGYSAALLGYALGIDQIEVKENLELRGFRRPGLISERVWEDLKRWSQPKDPTCFYLTEDDKNIILRGYQDLLPPQESFDFLLRVLRIGEWSKDRVFRLSLFLLHRLIVTVLWVASNKRPHDPLQISHKESGLFTKLFKLIFSQPSGKPPAGLEEDYQDNDFTPISSLEKKGLVYTHVHHGGKGKSSHYYILIPPHLAPLLTNPATFYSFFPKEEYDKFFGYSEALKETR